VYPNCIDMYFMRAKINTQLKYYDQAIIDIRSILKIAPKNWLAHEILGDLLLFLNDYKEALREYDAVIRYNDKLKDKIMPKKLVVLYKLKLYKDVINLSGKITSHNNEAPPIYYYYKGKALRHLRENVEAILSMEQVVKFDSAMEPKALYYIAKIKAKQKDFYGAHHLLNRLPKDLQIPKINDFCKLVEGVILYVT